jgi:hypothetical protein
MNGILVRCWGLLGIHMGLALLWYGLCMDTPQNTQFSVFGIHDRKMTDSHRPLG